MNKYENISAKEAIDLAKEHPDWLFVDEIGRHWTSYDGELDTCGFTMSEAKKYFTENTKFSAYTLTPVGQEQINIKSERKRGVVEIVRDSNVDNFRGGINPRPTTKRPNPPGSCKQPDDLRDYCKCGSRLIHKSSSPIAICGSCGSIIQSEI